MADYKCKIIESPTKLDIARALLDRKPLELIVERIELRVERIGTITVVLNSVIAEDGSAESWILKGYEEKDPNINFEAWLRTDRTAGHIKMIIKED